MVGWNQEKKRAEGHVMCGCYAAKKSGHGVCGTKSAARIGFEELLLQGSFANPTSLLGYVRQKKLLAFVQEKRNEMSWKAKIGRRIGDTSN